MPYKVRIWNAKRLDTIETEKESDDVDVCIYEDGEKLLEIPGKKTKNEETGMYETNFTLTAELTEEIGGGDFEIEYRINKEQADTDTLTLYKNDKKAV